MYTTWVIVSQQHLNFSHLTVADCNVLLTLRRFRCIAYCGNIKKDKLLISAHLMSIFTWRSFNVDSPLVSTVTTTEWRDWSKSVNQVDNSISCTSTTAIWSIAVYYVEQPQHLLLEFPKQLWQYWYSIYSEWVSEQIECIVIINPLLYCHVIELTTKILFTATPLGKDSCQLTGLYDVKTSISGFELCPLILNWTISSYPQYANSMTTITALVVGNHMYFIFTVNSAANTTVKSLCCTIATWKPSICTGRSLNKTIWDMSCVHQKQ